MDTTLLDSAYNNIPYLEFDSAVKLTEQIIYCAFEEQASDIHIDPSETYTLIRFRKDGLIIPRFLIHKDKHGELISRIKILGNLRTDVHTTPQDGRIKRLDTIPCDIRISIVPTHYGENAVLRILRNEVGIMSLDTLHININQQKGINEALTRRSGLIIVTGPTGSGKTTTLYTLLSLINKQRLIITIEDPIEYTIDHIRQIPVNVATGLTFETGLRSILRQNPDVIMVGEIRDAQTAAIAVHAALTGHLVLTTLHTKDAISVIPRLQDMNIPSYLISATLELIIAQRLVRTICKQCRMQKCDQCLKTGFAGRMGLYEIMIPTKDIKKLIYEHKSAEDIKTMCIESNMDFFKDIAIQKVTQGITSFEEALQAIS